MSDTHHCCCMLELLPFRDIFTITYRTRVDDTTHLLFFNPFCCLWHTDKQGSLGTSFIVSILFYTFSAMRNTAHNTKRSTISHFIHNSQTIFFVWAFGQRSYGSAVLFVVDEPLCQCYFLQTRNFVALTFFDGLNERTGFQ